MRVRVFLLPVHPVRWPAQMDLNPFQTANPGNRLRQVRGDRVTQRVQLRTAPSCHLLDVFEADACSTIQWWETGIAPVDSRFTTGLQCHTQCVGIDMYYNVPAFCCAVQSMPRCGARSD